MPTLADVQAARARIAPFVHRTPLIRSQSLSDRFGANVYLKLELFQKTGAFKVRGAFNRMLLLSEAERARGVVATSGGNHAQAVAYAARVLGIRARILMPENTPHNYVEATRAYGAEVELTNTIAEAFARAQAYQEAGWTYVHPFDDPWVIAGQGTLGLELWEDLPQLTDVVLSIGGGGLMAGVGAALKALRPDVRLWGVETEGADSMAQALRAGRVVELPAITSIAKTLGAPSVSERTLKAARRYLESVTVVSDAEAVEAMRWLLERAKVLTEPAASCTLAALERLADRFGPDRHVVLVLCGGNVALDDLCRYAQRFLIASARALA
ncbi:MAG: threonine/serine dehydratase [Bacteroidetes bacterium]|nr:threonine/serine dehydratase [Rhodothermia bacterium]MCS7155758.1 threonine/serine dehydratase [Bacteroidota bacterium]MCX7906141.1 threonine/serine dehydratase [Bacteroidota bacterium]